MQKVNLLADTDPSAVVQIYLADNSISNSFSRAKQSNGKPTLILGRIRNSQQSSKSHIQIDAEIFSSK
ncbi:MAG: hypothetical protein KME30_00005 [Iphinoe sp. HA4291-MV1]|nr:hypothetical protein [Iphinoe sp. HA4291-MV1]